MSFCKIIEVQQLRSHMLPLRRPNPLMGTTKKTRNIRWVGSQTFLVIYCCIYTLRNVGRESSRLLSQSDHMVNIFRLRSVFRWKDSEHAHMCCIFIHMLHDREGQGPVSQASQEAFNPFGLFWCCSETCSLSRDSHHSLILSCFSFFICLTHLILPNI